ncbi:hypothetical protein JI735_33665 (plasmid) [Paenibacillus sonchi]|uniref:Uncharacterized protein n=1 Tax=Paenibacillus sonchi TaxID=373687 RepID=A0A974SHF1_9BACL|nr:hypothetical protein [Paenibacillus sonchi]QQZ64600.1 hypothetical protein JI735_33665 [Paenibacillus sonchi]
MIERIISPAARTASGELVIELTKGEVSTQSFWEQSEIHLLSIIDLYITYERNMPGFDTFLKEAHVLLLQAGGWSSLSTLLLSTNNPELKARFEKDALFQSVPGWEDQEELKLDTVILGAKKRLEILIKRANRFSHAELKDPENFI